MAKNARYRVPYRRRREQKTDYQARRILATSEYPRLVVRTSNKGIIAQIVKSEIVGDIVLTQATSKDLSNYGWLANGKSIPAAYLIGIISGKKALKAGIKSANLDLGLKRPTKGSKIFAVVKGANDAGLKVSCDSDVIPPPERINGGDIVKYAIEMDDPYGYEKKFSIYLRKGLRPEMMTDHLEEIKKKIVEGQQ